jgi:CubicO group peptidase (beta-lactamase class C family)
MGINSKPVLKLHSAIFLVLLIQIYIPANLPGQEIIFQKDDIPGAQLDTIAAYIEAFPDNTQLSIAMVNDSVTSYLGFTKTAGVWSVVDNRDSVFEIGSITKVFTSTLLCSMIDREELSMEDPLSDILPFRSKIFEKDGKTITLRNLANHTSGLPRIPSNLVPLIRKNPENPYRHYNRALLREFFENQKGLESVPGDTYANSDLGVGVLGYLLEIKSAKPFEYLLLENIFSRYQMKSSTTNRSNIASRLVMGRDSKGKIVSKWDFDVLKGAGAILSTTYDLAMFVNANFEDDPILAFQREETFTINDHSGIALGWYILRTKGGQTLHWHNGATGGYRSQLVMDVENKKAVVILSNVSGSNPLSGNIDQLGFSLQETLQLYNELK